jgi:hypothetical protein
VLVLGLVLAIVIVLDICSAPDRRSSSPSPSTSTSTSRRLGAQDRFLSPDSAFGRIDQKLAPTSSTSVHWRGLGWQLSPFVSQRNARETRASDCAASGRTRSVSS